MHQIFIVTSTGYYPAVQGSPPTDDLSLLDDLVRSIEKLRPGRGKWYEIAVSRVTNFGTPIEEDRKRIDDLSDSLGENRDIIPGSGRSLW